MRSSAGWTSALLLVVVGCGPPQDPDAGTDPAGGRYDVVILNGRVMDPETGFDEVRHDRYVSRLTRRTLALVLAGTVLDGADDDREHRAGTDARLRRTHG